MKTKCVSSNGVFSRSSLYLAISASMIFGLTHSSAQAATITVNTNADNNSNCTLREAIASANNTSNQGNGCAIGSTGMDTITFSNTLASNTITLQQGIELDINNKNIEINANSISGGITISADESRVLDVYSTTLTLSNLTIKGGADAAFGAGIYATSSSIINIRNSTISDNTATESGGGIAASFYSEINLDSSTVTGNSASEGGGIDAYRNSTISLNGSTVSSNSGSSYGGGINTIDSILNLNSSTVSGNSASSGGGILANGSVLRISNSTISSNSVGTFSSEFTFGGGIYARAETIMDIVNSTISNNTTTIPNGLGGILASSSTSVNLINSIIANSQGGDCAMNGAHTIDSATIIENGSCGASRFGDPGLLSLADNGGMTLTHALNLGSIAIGTAIVSECPSNDQRGEPRDAGLFFPIKAANGNVAVISLGENKCDVGAVEFKPDDIL